MTIEWRKLSKFLIPIFAVVFALAIFGIIFATTTFADGYTVYADGERLGTLTTQEEGQQAVQNTQDKVSSILEDEEYSLPFEIEYQKETVEKTDLLEQEEMESILYDKIPDITDNYVLKVDDEVVGMSENSDELQKAVDNTVNEYVNENTTGVEIISNTEITYDTVSADTDNDIDTISSSLSAVSEDPVVYTAQQGDTVEAVMAENEMSTQNLLSLNPDLEEIIETSEKSVEISDEGDIIEEADAQTADLMEETPLEEGTEIVVAPEQHTLVVETREMVSHEETIPYETTTIEDDTMYEGETEIRTEGMDGIMTQREIVTYQNGIETDREDSSCMITAHPIDEVIAVGTKEVPEPEQQETVTETTSNTDTAVATDNNTATTNENNGTVTTTTTTTTADNNTDNNTSTVTYNNNDNNTSTTVTTNDNATSNDITTTDNTQTQETETYTEPVQETTTTYSNMDLRNQIVSYAMNFLGCSYVHGGHGPYTFDCSGLTGYVYAHFGISLPWTVEGQYAYGTYVPLDVSQMLPGDLIFWSYGGSTPTHVGMYIGNGQYIQATKPGDVVRINTVSSYAGQPLVGCRRIIQ